MQVLKEDIRGRILAVAEQRFGQQGYSKTSMREIAGAVGVGVGNIYNYFRNKDELFCEVSVPSCTLWKPCCRSITAYAART